VGTGLPIERIRSEFERRIRQANLVVEAPTGSGKSTCLPRWCAAAGRVLVVEPRRIACRALAAHVARQDGTPLGGETGYAIRFDSRYGPDTRLIFATPGIALGWLADNGLSSFQIVILDEFHERRWDTDLLAALLHHRGGHRLIITSATVEGERLARYINGERLQAQGRLHPVQIRYAAEEGTPTPRDLAQRSRETVTRLLEEQALVRGDILVFLPGKGEIQSAQQMLSGLPDFEVIPLHAGIDSRLQDLALNRGPGRRIILATNVAETSLTIPGVSVVIDSGLERRTHHRNGRTVLGLHPVSLAAADQRAGRAGRLGPGLCIRLWGRTVPLEAFTPPEVLREELTQLFLAAAAAGAAAQTLEFPDALPSHAIERALQRLRGMKAIDMQGQLTPHGRQLAALPLDPLFSHLITAMPDAETRAAMIDLAATLSTGRPLLRPARTPEEGRAFKAWTPESCDATARIRLIRCPPPKALPVDLDTLQEARWQSRHTRSLLGLPKPHNAEPLPRQALLETVLRATPELAFVRRKKRPQALGNGHSEIEIGRESLFPEDALAAVVFDQHSLPGKGTRHTLSFGICMARVSPAMLAAAGLGSIEYRDPLWEQGELKLLAQRTYAGRIIATELLTPRGEVARKALASLILERRLMKGCGPQLETDIEAWNLYLQLGLGTGEPVQALPWLEQRLAALGVESDQDLALIGPQDLRFCGIPEWEREVFDQRYPRQLQMENMRVALTYDPRRKRITLERQAGSRRTAPRPMDLPAWPGWKVYFKDASRVINIR